MLMVKTYLAPSEQHGIGLFAEENISKNQIVWMYEPLVDITFTPEEWMHIKKTVSGPSLSSIERYSYKEKNRFILCTDNAQFMNHCMQNNNVFNSENLNTMYANKDIKRGEELLCNYFEYSDEDDHHIGMLR